MISSAPSVVMAATCQHVLALAGVFQFQMYWPPVASYRTAVTPLVTSSISSTGAAEEQPTCLADSALKMSVAVSSVVPANTSNFSGTVEPPLTEFSVRPVSIGA